MPTQDQKTTDLLVFRSIERETLNRDCGLKIEGTRKIVFKNGWNDIFVICLSDKGKAEMEVFDNLRKSVYQSKFIFVCQQWELMEWTELDHLRNDFEALWECFNKQVNYPK
jgi:hypothetical protein